MTKTRVCDVAVVGGGVMGCSVAYHLMKSDPTLEVVVVERDPSYTRSSSALSVGNARVQFSLRQNIQISLYALEVFGSFEEEMSVDGQGPDIRFRQEGNLFLHEPRTADEARRGWELQRSLGGEVEWLATEEITGRYPFLETRELAGGTFGRKDGHLDGYALLRGYRIKAASLGAEFVVGYATRIDTDGDRVQGVRLESGADLRAPIVVNCTGAHEPTPRVWRRCISCLGHPCRNRSTELVPLRIEQP
jgi:glycine/D-amino acid oxidase-like deaminating enzyme